MSYKIRGDVEVGKRLSAGLAVNTPVWLASKDYLQGDIVRVGTEAYMSLTDFTSGASFVEGNWDKLGSIQGAVTYRGSLVGTADLTGNATGNTYLDGGTTMKQGDFFIISTDGTLTTNTGTNTAVNIGDQIYFNVDTTDATVTDSEIDKIDNTEVNNDRVFADNTTVAPATAGEPTVAEITVFTAANSIINSVVYYTGTDTSTDTPTYVYYVDNSGVVTEIQSPSGGGSILEVDGTQTADRTHDMATFDQTFTNAGDWVLTDGADTSTSNKDGIRYSDGTNQGNYTKFGYNVTNGSASSTTLPSTLTQNDGANSATYSATKSDYTMTTTTQYEEFTRAAATFGSYIGNGTPEGVQAANVGSTYRDQDTGELYRKATGTGNTGWEIIGGAGSGTTLSRIQVSLTTTTNNAGGTQYEFDTNLFTQGGDLSLNTTGNIGAIAGLQAGKTYKLSWKGAIDPPGGSAATVFRFVDLTASAQIGREWEVISQQAAVPESGQSSASAFFTPSVTTEIGVDYVSGAAGEMSALSTLTVEEVPSTSVITAGDLPITGGTGTLGQALQSNGDGTATFQDASGVTPDWMTAAPAAGGTAVSENGGFRPDFGTVFSSAPGTGLAQTGGKITLEANSTYVITGSIRLNTGASAATTIYDYTNGVALSPPFLINSGQPVSGIGETIVQTTTAIQVNFNFGSAVTYPVNGAGYPWMTARKIA